ncbi:MAG: outer membrane lipoprotein-sorting protein [bacterium]|nr:outer membrane lipoprotein-sorting protein [bacterium]
MRKPILLLLLILATPSLSLALTADEIIDKSNLAYYYAANDGKARAKMYIKDSRGRERYREMTILRKDIKDGGKQNFYIYFHEPADVSKMVFMVWKQAEGDDDRWLYLPAIDLVKRIATSDKRSSFAGGVFTYEDVSGRRTGDDTHTLLRDEKFAGKDAYVIKNVPKDAALVEFDHYISWIDKETFLPIKGEYYNDKGKLYRTIEVEKTAVIDGYPTSIKGVGKNLDTGLTTTIEFVDVKYNVGLKEKIFQERYLRKAPREVEK